MIDAGQDLSGSKAAIRMKSISSGSCSKTEWFVNKESFAWLAALG